MPLTSGTSLGSFEIVSAIGAGGMGEVYRARDTKLNRDVALKILPAEFTLDPDRLARFKREAQVLASLNHPNIAAIFGLEEPGSGQTVQALVLELVEGPTLADRIGQGPLPLDEALAIARQIADALEAAHEQGIIHRDLKPANIKLKVRAADVADCTVKVLDFGLAKIAEPSGSGPQASGLNLTNSPTITSPAMMSGVGMLLGTATYMAPEQAKGRPADKRSDIWAFGCVLYEMLTGKRAFDGEDIGETLAAVIKSDPDWNVLPAQTSPAIRKLLRQCLTKDRRRRLQAIGDARIVLEDPARDEPPAIAPAGRALSSPLAWLTATVLALMVAVLAFLLFRQPSPAARTLRYTIAPPEGSAIHSFAISPSGEYLVIAASVKGKQQLWLRRLDELQMQALATTEDATYPFWSPDSRYIGFFAQGKLKKIAVGGGPAQSLCNAVDTRGGSWNADDVIVFSQSGNSPQGIQRVSAAGGMPVDVFATKGTFRYPAFLPDGRHFLYTDIRPSDINGIYVSSLDGVDNRRILPDVSGAVYAPSRSGSVSGRVLFSREGILMALPLDGRTGQPSGDVFPVVEGVVRSLVNAGYAPVTVSQNGVLLYWTGEADSGANQMVWRDRTGKLLGTIDTAGQVFLPTISPTEKAIAFSRVGAANGRDVWLWDLTRSSETRLTTAPGRHQGPVWSPSGDRIAIGKPVVPTGQSTLYMKAANGGGQDEVLLTWPGLGEPAQWSRDGQFIVYESRDPKTNQDVWVLPLGDPSSTQRQPIPFLRTDFNELNGQLSPDSRWMAYTSDESGRREVYVRQFPSGEGRLKISVGGGQQPRWQGDGREMFYVAPDGKMMAVSMRATLAPKPSFDPAVPMPLFESAIAAPEAAVGFQYDVTGDGKRFLIVTPATPAAGSPPLVAVVNWNVGLEK